MRKFIFFSWIFILIGCCFIMPISLATSDSVYVWSSFSNTLYNKTTTNTTSTNTETNSNETSTSEKTNTVSTTPVDLGLESASAILIEQNTGKMLYEHNSHEQLRPASVTKVMSILLIMEALDSGKIQLSDKVPCSEAAASMGGSQIWLDVREELTVDEMLKAICVASANDCVVAMAEYLEGSQEAFVAKMNTRAKELRYARYLF